MRRSLAVVVLAVLCGVLLWLRPWSALAPVPSATPCVRALTAAASTEDEWLAGEVLRDLHEMTAAARGATPRQAARVRLHPEQADEATLALTVDFGSGPRALRLTRFIWSPDDYAGSAAALLTEGGLRAVEPTHDAALPQSLTNPRAEVLAAADLAVSARLARSLLDAGAHEDAALLLSVFALREAAGSFSDVRRLLCRATAHLALARALRAGGAPARAGRLAEAALLVLAGRGVDAARALETLGSDADPAARAFTRALALRLRDDWREPAGASLLERLARYRAETDARSVQHALRDLDGQLADHERELPDWGRVALQPTPDVGSSWRFLPEALDREWGELLRARAALGLAALDERAWVQTVNVPAQRCVRPDGPRVLGFAAWAGAFQRHAALIVVTTDWFYRATLGQPREADLKRFAVEARLAGTDVLPLASLRRAKRDANGGLPRLDAATLARVTERALAQPEALSPLLWAALEGTTSADCLAPSAATFLARVCPFGTAHDFAHRRFLCRGAAPLAARLRAIAPEDFELQDLQLGANPAQAGSAADMAKVYGPRAAYDVRALWHMASAVVASDEERVSARATLCDLSAQYCTWLGDEHVARGRDAAAAAAYQRALDESLEPVSVSHNLGFLSRYYDAHGQPARAQQVAASAGQVGSSTGLETLAAWFERHGHLAEAAALYEDVAARYDADENVSPPLLGFYYRADRVRHDKGYAGRFDAAAKECFPGGLQRFDDVRRARPPQRGLKLMHEGWRTLHREGLRAGDLLVAVDGWQVETLDQFHVALKLDPAPEVRFVVWRHGRYLDFAPRLANRSFEVRLQPYTVRS